MTEPNDDEVITIRCALDGEEIQLSRTAASRAGFLKRLMDDMESNVLPVDRLAAKPTCLVAKILKHHAAGAAGSGGAAAFPSLADVAPEAIMDAMNAANHLEATEAFSALAKELFWRMEGLDDVEALRQMLGVRDEEAIAEADCASILAEPLFEPEGEAATSPEGGVSSLSSMGASAPPPLGRSISMQLTDDAIFEALEHAPTMLLRTLKAVSSAWKLRARHELCSRACPVAARPLNAAGRPAPVPTRRDDIQGIDAEFLIHAGRPQDVVVAGQALPGLARLHGFGFTVDIAAARQADLEIDDDGEEEEEEEDALDSVLRLRALRACITPEQGGAPRELLLATIALAASGTVAGVPVQELREGGINELDLRDVGLGPASAQLIGMLLPVNASVTSVTLLANRFDDATVAMLLKLKEEKPNLTTLCGLQPNQTEADFSGWGLTPQDARLLAPEILVHASLTSVR